MLQVHFNLNKKELSFMRKLTIIPLSIAAIFTACDPGSTAPDPLIKGDLIYERHVDNSIGTVKCNVYATDYSTSLDLKVTILSDESYISEQIDANFKNPATFRAEANLAGLFLMSKNELCNEMKELSADMENGTFSCNDNNVSISAKIPNAEEQNKSFYVSVMKNKMSSICDDSYDKFVNMFNKLSQQINQDGNNTSNEKPTSCNVIENGNSAQLVITYPNKNALITTTNVNGIYSMKEEYTGFDDTTLARVCAAYKTETDIKDVSCTGSTITYNSNDSESPDFATYVAYEKEIVCPALLSGTLTLEDIWFEK